MYFETQLKLTQSATHMQSFKEICDMVQNGYEDFKETASSLLSRVIFGDDIVAEIKNRNKFAFS